MAAELDPDLIVLPADWPGVDAQGPRPGDPQYFVPQGLAMAAPAIYTPYSDAPEPGYYSGTGTITHPIKSAPINDDAGGVIYFSRHVPADEIVVALDLFGFRSLIKDYALFISGTKDPRADNFLDQMRIISHDALRHFYRADTSSLTNQKLDAGEAVGRFMEWQAEKWENSRGTILAGCLGGDGDWAKERMAYGAMIENSYWGVYRVWSRAWLVTK